MNPVEEIRRAAQLMRERAEAATPGAWRHATDESPEFAVVVDDVRGTWGLATGLYSYDAEHIASWHPGVALAIADWLDWDANALETEYQDLEGNTYSYRHALAVARAYWGGAS